MDHRDRCSGGGHRYEYYRRRRVQIQNKNQFKDCSCAESSIFIAVSVGVISSGKKAWVVNGGLLNCYSKLHEHLPIIRSTIGYRWLSVHDLVDDGIVCGVVHAMMDLQLRMS